jgi:hypothetical protein
MGFLSALFDKQEQQSRKAFKAANITDFISAFEHIKQGGDINYVGKVRYDGYEADSYSKGTLGHAALAQGNMKALEALLDLGLDPEIKSQQGQTLLVTAIMCSNNVAAELLINKGARCDIMFGDMNSLEEKAREKGMTGVADLIAKKCTELAVANNVSVGKETDVAAPAIKFGKK